MKRVSEDSAAQWGSVRSILSVFLALFLSTRLCAESIGFEFEYAAEGYSEPDVTRIPEARYRRMLEIIREGLNDPQGVITMQPFPRKPNSQMAIYKDPQGREWKVTPESVNTTGYDGFELVVPPARNPQEDALIVEMVKRVDTTGEFKAGLKSSSHITADVSHLIAADGTCPKLYDFIVHAESNWPQIYAAMNPSRYGTLVNRFSVPLALDHPELLREIAKVPLAERTFARLKAIFESYHQKELDLNKGDSNKAWKYRGMNYKKLFGLGGVPQANLVELRIGDLATSGSLPGKMAFMRALVTRGAEAEPGAPFRNPFNGLKRSELFHDVNNRIFNQSSENYDAFLMRLRLPPKDYPAFNGSKSPPSLALSREARQRLEAELDTHRPVRFNGKTVTFGFEAEFRGPNAGKIVKNPREYGSEPNRELYPFLSPDTSREGTGNTEVRSVPHQTLDETINNMTKIREALGSDLKGFHLHFRVPAEAMEKIPEAERRAWLQRVADAVLAWRLQNRKHYFALMVSTQGRPESPAYMDSRNTIRVQRKGDEFDIEIRGFMQSEKEIREMVRTILLGVQHPELVQGYVEAQKALNKKPSMVSEMEKFAWHQHGRQLTPPERELLRKLERSLARSNHHLPFMGFEEAPYLSTLEARRVADSTFTFKRDLMRLLMQVTEEGKYPTDAEVEKQYRRKIQLWAERVDLEHLLKQSLLLPPENANLGMKDNEWLEIRELLLSAEAAKKEKGHERLKNSERFIDLVKKLIAEPLVELEREVLTAIKDRPFREVRDFYERLIQGSIPELRERAFSQLGELSDPHSLEYLVDRTADTHPGFQRTWALRALITRGDTGEWDLENPRIRQVLGNILETLNNGHVAHRHAAFTLMEELIEKLATTKPEQAKDLTAGLIALLRDSELRETVADYLKRFSARLTTAAIVRGLEGTIAYHTYEARAVLLDLLKGRRGPGVLEAVTEHANHDSIIVRAAAARALSSANDVESARILDKLSKDSNREVRRNVAKALAGRSDNHTFDAVLRMMADVDPDIRGLAAGAMGGRGLNDRVRALIPKILGGDDLSMSTSLAEALGKRTTADLSAVIRVVQASNNAKARQNLLKLVMPVRLQNEPDAHTLVKDFLRDPDRSVALAALELFSGRPANEALEAFKMGASHPDAAVRKEAGEWLAGARVDVTPQQQAIIDETVERLLRDSEPAVREAGLLGVGLTRGRTRSQLLRGLLASNDPAKWKAATSVLKGGLEEDLDVLRETLRHRNLDTAAAAAEIAAGNMARIPLEDIFRLRPLLSTGANLAVLNYLKDNPSREALGYLLSFLEGFPDPNAPLAREILAAMVLKAQSQEKEAMLDEIFKRKSDGAREIGYALAAVSPTELLSRLQKGLASADVAERVAAAKALGLLDWSSEMISELNRSEVFKRLLQDERVSVREAALASLKAQKQGLASLVDTIVTSGNDTSRRLAISALEGRNEEPVRELLTRLSTHESFVVRENAKRALASLGPAMGTNCAVIGREVAL